MARGHKRLGDVRQLQSVIHLFHLKSLKAQENEIYWIGWMVLKKYKLNINFLNNLS